MSSAITNAAATFTGTSTYASSLQQVITKAVSMASLPLQQIEDQQTVTSNKLSALNSLESYVSSLSTSLQALSSSSQNSVTADVSDSSVLTATASSGAIPGTYTITVTDPGSYSSAVSKNELPPVADPNTSSISASSTFSLTVGSSTYTLAPASNSLNALAAAINAQNSGVQATIINVGNSFSPDYRLAIQSSSLSDDQIQLNDGSQDLLDQSSTGSPAEYTVNGLPSGGSTSSSSTITVAPGLTATLAGAGTSKITVALNASNISSALSSFVSAYNDVHSQLASNYGQGSGALSGDNTVYGTSSVLSQLASYTSSFGTVQSLSDLGIQFQKDGTLAFDSSVISSMSSSQLSQAESFLGTPTSGGFLQNAVNALNSLTDSSSGLLTNAVSNLNDLATQEQDEYTAQQDRINQLQTSLTQQMAAADATIASLENQTSFLTSLFSTMNANKNASS